MGLSKDEVLQKLETAPDAKFVIRTTEEDTAFLENFKQSEIEKSLGEKVNELHSRYDSDILEVTGLRKDPKEKTYEFNKRILKDTLSKVSAYEKRIEELSKGSGSKNDEKIRELEAQIVQIIKDKDEAIMAERQEKTTYRTRTEIEKSLLKLPQEPTIPEAARKALIDTTINGLMTSAEWRDDGLVFKDEKGEVLRNKTTNKPLTPDEILADVLNPILKKDRKLEGVDINSDQTKAKSVTVLPAHVTTKVELSKYLASLGWKRESKEYIEAFALGKDLPSGY
jgi:hypothetical protein